MHAVSTVAKNGVMRFSRPRWNFPPSRIVGTDPRASPRRDELPLPVVPHSSTAFPSLLGQTAVVSSRLQWVPTFLAANSIDVDDEWWYALVLIAIAVGFRLLALVTFAWKSLSGGVIGYSW